MQFHVYLLLCVYLFVAVFRVGVLLGDHTKDQLGRPHTLTDASKQLVSSSHLTNVHPTGKARHLQVLLDGFHFGLMVPLVA